MCATEHSAVHVKQPGRGLVLAPRTDGVQVRDAGVELDREPLPPNRFHHRPDVAPRQLRVEQAHGVVWVTIALRVCPDGEALQVVTPLTLSPIFLCIAILGSQIVLGLLLTMAGCKMARFGVASHPHGT